MLIRSKQVIQQLYLDGLMTGFGVGFSLGAIFAAWVLKEFIK